MTMPSPDYTLVAIYREEKICRSFSWRCILRRTPPLPDVCRMILTEEH